MNVPKPRDWDDDTCDAESDLKRLEYLGQFVPVEHQIGIKIALRAMRNEVYGPYMIALEAFGAGMAYALEQKKKEN